MTKHKQPLAPHLHYAGLAIALFCFGIVASFVARQSGGWEPQVATLSSALMACGWMTAQYAMLIFALRHPRGTLHFRLFLLIVVTVTMAVALKGVVEKLDYTLSALCVTLTLVSTGAAVGALLAREERPIPPETDRTA